MAIKISEILGKEVYTTKGLYVGKTYDAMVDIEKSSVSGIVISDASKGCLKDNVSDPTKKIVLPYRIVESIGNIILIKPPATERKLV
ncbi:PRC-barrel domain-containing protein [Methanothermococcus okinawensis]|uniref:PRC-barrel domain protein n=1 Tax=Methanothermococcus okinawensis (strain DSM 14208 / JCM 11175 / IH1) TaxID=647113 RepID=F8AMU9_METOI|nr:PRC-barrel domain-containing protein [Methanothermococcus okinawensis]AEH06072.1 PRC-barrel domain protein [Methanothermococcus okinawensis IH1]